MADVTISSLTQGTPLGSGLIPYSTGSSTLASPISAIFQSASTPIAIGVTNPGSFGGTGLTVESTVSNYNLDNGIISAQYKNTAKRVNIGFDNSIDCGYIQSVHSGVGNKSLLLNANGGTVGVGTTNAKSTITVMGSERAIAADAASVYEQDRYFTFKKHYSTKGVSNSSYTRLIQFRPYLSGTTNYPTGTNFWTRVGVYIRMGGHSSQVGNGERCWVGSYDYVGNGIGSVITLQDLQNGNVPNINVGFSGWEAFIDIKGADGGIPGGVFGGYCYIELNFGSGEGNLGEAIVWNLTEYY